MTNLPEKSHKNWFSLPILAVLLRTAGFGLAEPAAETPNVFLIATHVRCLESDSIRQDRLASMILETGEIIAAAMFADASETLQPRFAPNCGPFIPHPLFPITFSDPFEEILRGGAGPGPDPLCHDGHAFAGPSVIGESRAIPEEQPGFRLLLDLP